MPWARLVHLGVDAAYAEKLNDRDALACACALIIQKGGDVDRKTGKMIKPIPPQIVYLGTPPSSASSSVL